MEEYCKNIPIDCEDDNGLGHAFDSCYTYEMYAEDKNGSTYVHKIKSCSIKMGCLEMRDMMCDNINRTLPHIVNLQCTIQCCDDYDYCNAEPHTNPDVQGYKSNSKASGVFPWILLIFACSMLAVLQF